jgi:FkbM family methyltransferase
MSAARSRPDGALKRLLARRSPVAREKAARRRFLESAESFTPYVVAERREGTFVLPVHGAAKLFANPRRTEFVVLARALQTLVEHGFEATAGTIVDVGANIGTTVVPALVLHGFERGVAIEPDPENRKVLRASLALSGVDDRVAVVGAAASSGPGEATFTRQRWGGGKHRIGSGRLRDDPAQASDLISVETVSLDDLAAQGVIDADSVSLLWLDVQGHEGEVLEGGSSLLRRRVPVVFALRPRELSRPGILAELLGRQYDTLVDLRHPSLKEGWTPELETIDALEQRFGRRLTTDMLAFNRAD